VTADVTYREGAARPVAPMAPSTMAKGWAQHGACVKAKPDALFVRGAAQRAAKKVCVGCTVGVDCLADSLDNRTEFGVWGGMTERQRRALLIRWPDVTSWRAVLEADRPRQQHHAS
jgi:WhiB family transcriptional regulator, redox-sensing transcriptional regulator